MPDHTIAKNVCLEAGLHS